jgi:arylsulfatase A-like enzyme
MEVPGDHPYSTKSWPKPDRDFAGVVSRLDRDVGAVLAKLRELDVEQNTLVMFASDNGPHREGGNHPGFFDSNGPVRGIKRDLYDGGIRTPFLVRWPGITKASSVSNEVCAFWDLLPTLAEVVGEKPPAGLDGMSIIGAMKGEKLPSRTYLYWEFHENGFSQAVRMGNWKGVRLKNRHAPIQLYDLVTDLGETQDVAASHADIVKRISEIMNSARTDSKEFPIKERT